MSSMGCHSVANHHLFKAGVRITDDCFIIGDYVFYRRADTIFYTASNVVNWPPSPSMTEHITNSYFVYNTNKKTSSRIDSIAFYKALTAYQNTKFSSKDLNDLLDKALEDSFVMYIWFKSQHSQVTNYEVNT